MAAVLVARIFDLVFTVLIAPRLESESNPFVVSLGFGWTRLLASNAVLLVAVGAGLAWALRKRAAMGPPPGHLSATEHHLLLLYGRRISGRDVMWVTPPLQRLLYFLAMILPYAVLFASIGATAHNILSVMNVPYAQLTAPLFAGTIPPFTVILGMASTVLSAAVWFTGEHRRHEAGRVEADAWDDAKS
jgi:hypothetical protein